MLNSLKKNVSISKVEQNKLIERYQNTGCISSRNQVFMSITRLIIAVVVKKTNLKIPTSMKEDYIHEGYVVALKAMKKFNVKAHTALSTYITKVVSNEMSRLIQTQYHSIIKVPVSRLHNTQKTRDLISVANSFIFEPFNLENQIENQY